MKLNKLFGSRSPLPRLSVTTKIAISLSLLIMFLMTAVGTSLVLRDRSVFINEFQEKGWNIVHTALQFTGGYLQTGDMDFLNDMVEKIGTYQDISYAMVLDTGGEVLAHTEKKQVGAKINDEVTKNVLTAKSETMNIRYNESGKPTTMDFYSPIKTADGTMGYFRLGVGLSGLNKHTEETILSIFLICLAAVIAGIFLAALITKKILIKPLTELTAATEKLATGDFSYKVPVHNQDELGELATSFNTMTVHLANLIQSVKSSAADINKSAEQILGRLQTSDHTNNRLSQTLDILKQGASGQMEILKQPLALSEQLCDQSKHAMDCILQILSEVNKTVQVGESGIAAISKIAANLDESDQSLKNTRSLLKQSENKGLQLGQTIEHFSSLLEKNSACTVQVALQAARSGNEELTRTAEDMHRISEEFALCVNEMSGKFGDIRNTWREVEGQLEGNLNSLVHGRDAIEEARVSLGKVLQSLLQSKDIIENIASAAHRQSASIEDIRRSQSEVMDELIKSINKSSGAGSDTKLQMESLHDIDSLAKKLMRMVDRLNVLSLQFKV